MKARKRLSFEDLKAETVRQVTRFQVDIQSLKRRVEGLINASNDPILKRAIDDRNFLEYIA